MMDKSQVAQVVAYVMEGQGRQVSGTDLDIWREVIGDLPFSLARDAAVALLRDTDRFIAPATVRQRALDLARERIRAVENPPQPPSGLSPKAYEQWLAGWRNAAMVGAAPDEIAQAGLSAIGMGVEDMPALTNSVPELRLSSALVDEGEVLSGVVVHDDPAADPQAGGMAVPRPLF